jgi:hypothetical protein
MDALADRVEKLEANEPTIRPIRLLTKPTRAPVARQTPAETLIWELQVQAFPMFNGDRQAGLIRTFQDTLMPAV